MFQPFLMTKSFVLLLSLVCGGFLFLNSCESSVGTSDDTEIVEERDPRFLQCYYEDNLAKNRCDSVLRDFFGNDGFSFVELNAKKSFLGCDEGGDLQMIPFGDENCCAPRTYDLVYDLKIKGKLIHEIPMFAGANMTFDFISPQYKIQLEGYKLLLEDKFKVDYQGLYDLLETEGMNPEHYSIELVRDTLFPDNEPAAFFWEVYSEEEEALMTTVHAMTGKFRHLRPSKSEMD